MIAGQKDAVVMQSNENRNSGNRIAKIAFGIMAIVCLSAGLILYLFAADLGMDPDTARFVAIAFLVAGFADYLVLRFWDRLMKKR